MSLGLPPNAARRNKCAAFSRFHATAIRWVPYSRSEDMLNVHYTRCLAAKANFFSFNGARLRGIPHCKYKYEKPLSPQLKPRVVIEYLCLTGYGVEIGYSGSGSFCGSGGGMDGSSVISQS